MMNQSFRVIIVGAGPVGLYLAHALSLARIDFVILERRTSVVFQGGAGIILWPHSARLLDQLGILEHVQEYTSALHSKTDLRADGYIIDSCRMWEKIEQKHGYPVLPLLRRELLNVLYEQLPNNDTVVRFEAEVANCEVYDNGVRVHLKDGTVEEGSIVVGADGTHSRVRQVMEDLQMKENRRASKTVMAANYQSIYAVGPNRLGIPDGVFYEMRGSGIAANLVTTPTEMILILYRRLPTAALTHTYYTIEQMNEFAASFFDTTVAPGVKFGDIWGDFDKASARLVNQEEGFAKLWHHGRIALLGDSATRTTSITGLGLNLGLHSAALLANELQKCLVSDKTPDTSVLSQLFERCKSLPDALLELILC